MQVIAAMQSWIISIITSVSHDPSETMIMVMIIICVENCFAAS